MRKVDNNQTMAKLLMSGASNVLPPFVAQQSTNSQLNPMDELMFRQWVQTNKVPFNPDAGQNDYDMRGFWKGLQQGHPMAQQSINPNDNRMHYSDYWKTPTHESFSSESQWADPSTPSWINGSQLATPGGHIVFDEQQKNDLISRLLSPPVPAGKP